MFKLPLKQRLQVLDETIEFVSAGTGASTLVLVNGSGGPIEGWHRVFGPLTESVDRAETMPAWVNSI